MSIDIIKTYKDIPFEEGKTYKTKFATGEYFMINSIKHAKVTQQAIEIKGIYLNNTYLGDCTISPERLIPERKEIGEHRVCSKCKTVI